MRCLCFGDMHAHFFKDFDKPDDLTGSARFTQILSTLDYMYNYCKENDIHTILFSGDLFHARKKVETSVINHVFRKICGIASDDIKLILLVGNHDQVDNSQFPEHSLEIFKGISNITVLDRFTSLRVEDTYIFPLPFCKDTDYVKEAIDEYVLEAKRMEDGFKSILLGHLGISGARTGNNNHIMQDAFTMNDLKPTVFDYGIFGHYHKPQFLTTNFAYTGSPLQHNFGDSGNECGFIYLDTNKNIMKHIPINTTPKFVTVTKEEDLEKNIGNYVCFQTKQSSVSTVKEKLDGLGLNSKIDIVKEFKDESRINVSTSMSEKDIIETYCKEKGREDAVGILLGIIREVN